MWWLLPSVLRFGAGQLERQVGRSIAKRLDAEQINNDEAFAQRINGDLQLGDFQKGMAAYKADPAYWHRLYGEDPQFSNNHAPDAAHGGPVSPSAFWLDPKAGNNSTNANTPASPQVPPAQMRPERSLGSFTYDPSQGSPFVAAPAPTQPSPDGSLSLNDAYLEYRKRLNAGQSSGVTD